MNQGRYIWSSPRQVSEDFELRGILSLLFLLSSKRSKKLQRMVSLLSKHDSG